MAEIQNYLVPRELDEALQAMHAADVTVVCGGTDLTPQTDAGVREYASTLMNIRRIDQLSGIELSDDKIRIAPLVTVSEIMKDKMINECASILVEACDQFASDQIRNAASLGGNICNASPAGDMIIPLLVLDASVELASWRDEAKAVRVVPLSDFFIAPGKTVKQDNELLTSIIFDKPAKNFVSRFRKSGPRPALEISIVAIGVGGNLENGIFTNVRVAMGSVAPTPIRATRVEAALEGKTLDPGIIKQAIVSAGEDATPIDDMRASAWYRDHLVRVFTEEVLNHVA